MGSRDFPHQSGLQSPPEARACNAGTEWPGQPMSFAQALVIQMKKHQDSCHSLSQALRMTNGKRLDHTLRDWVRGKTLPRQQKSLKLLSLIERHYRLREGYFAQFIVMHGVSYLRRPCKGTLFQASLSYEMNKHGDTSQTLANAICRARSSQLASSITNWKTGRSAPNRARAFELLDSIEQRYSLAEGHFKKLLRKPENALEAEIRKINRAWRGAVRWHLPENFNELPNSKQQEIMSWISENVLGASSRYGRFQSLTTRHAFSMVFPEISSLKRNRRAKGELRRSNLVPDDRGAYGTVAAPTHLSSELQCLLDFQTAPLPPLSTHRHSRWSQPSAEMAAIKFGLLFGALAAAPFSNANGLGVPLNKLTFALLAFPKVWDWFLRWKERRRGFFTSDDVRYLEVARALLISPTGWIRQNRELQKNLQPISNLISANEIRAARRNWAATCEKGLCFVRRRIVEVRRMQRRHRDPFEPIMPILNSDSPLLEYKKIADEVLKYMPDLRDEPFRAAINLRAYLLIRFGMHSGFRQRNLRELMLTPKGGHCRSAAELEDMQRGELRWLEPAKKWEIFAPAVAFKNSKSSFFGGRPFRLVIPDIDRLYGHINTYIEIGRPALLAGRPDPGTFFVRSARSSHRSAVYDLFSFNEAWKTIIQRYGIFNPYTRRGAIAGLRPHGPHAVRDVIATHVLKQTGSYELASYAIQDTVGTVMANYTRFLPQEKVARAAAVLNQVWHL